MYILLSVGQWQRAHLLFRFFIYYKSPFNRLRSIGIRFQSQFISTKNIPAILRVPWRMILQRYLFAFIILVAVT